MENGSVASYLQRLHELVSNSQVTDRSGAFLSLEEGMTKAVQMISSVGAASGKVLLIGNGGSAAIASHMQNDLCKTNGIRALVFNEAPLLTALTNDYGYESAFERLAELWVDPGDLMIAVSSSGKSENILRAVEAALRRRGRVITFSGFRTDNPLRSLGDLNFYIASDSYGHVEITHMMLMHALTDRVVESRLAAKDARS